jgi:hypothetical protein
VCGAVVSSYNPLDPEQRTAAKEEQAARQRLEAEQLADDTKWLMADARGRRLMRRWLAMCHVDHTTFTGNSTGMFKEGERNVGLQLKAQVTEFAFEDYVTMLREMQPLAQRAHSAKK